MEIKIEDAQPEHVEEIADVLYRVWLATYPSEELGITKEDIEYRFKDRKSESNLQERREEISGLDPNRRFIVALDSGKVVGLCRGDRGEEFNELKAIYILPEYQSRGIGKMLWEEMYNFFDPSKDIVVHVASYNDKAIGFYKKLGFVDTGERLTQERLRMRNGNIIPEMVMIISRT